MRSAKIKRISKSNQQSKCKYFHDAKIWVGANSNSPLMMDARMVRANSNSPLMMIAPNGGICSR